MGLDGQALARQSEALGDAEEEVTQEFARYLNEQAREGVELPDGFPERAALAVAARVRGALARLAFRCVSAGVDSAAAPGTVPADDREPTG